MYFPKKASVILLFIFFWVNAHSQFYPENILNGEHHYTDFEILASPLNSLELHKSVSKLNDKIYQVKFRSKKEFKLDSIVTYSRISFDEPLDLAVKSEFKYDTLSNEYI